MKLLLDQNLPARLLTICDAAFPGSSHVVSESLDRSSDLAIWAFARDGGWVILSKDGDFRYLSEMYGHPPKVVWLRIGNASVVELVSFTQNVMPRILDFVHDEDASLLIAERER